MAGRNKENKEKARTEDSLSINKLFLLSSAVTGRPYVDPDRNAHGFYKKEEAELFIHETKEDGRMRKYESVFVDEPRYYHLSELLAICYAAGAQVLHIRAGQDDTSFTINEKHLPKRYYNNELNWALCLLKTTKKESCLSKLAHANFLIPAKIAESGTDILYATTKIPNHDESLYLLFSDMEEYQIWASKVKGWAPLQVSYATLWRIGKNLGYVINVMGNRYVIYDRIAKKMPPPEQVPEANSSRKTADPEDA